MQGVCELAIFSKDTIEEERVQESVREHIQEDFYTVIPSTNIRKYLDNNI